MNLGRYLKKLLLENETVIIPGLGAFISEYNPAQIDEVTGEILPPSKTFRFDRRIKNNDGVLSGYIASLEQILPSEALKKIDIEKEDILFRLDKGEAVSLGTLGKLTMDATGEINFTSDLKENYLLDSYGLGPVSLSDRPAESPSEEQSAEVLPDHFPENRTETSDIPPIIPSEPAPPAYIPNRKKWWIRVVTILLIAAIGIYLIFRPSQKNQTGPMAVKVEPVDPGYRQQQSPDSILADTAPDDTLRVKDDPYKTGLSDTISAYDDNTMETPGHAPVSADSQAVSRESDTISFETIEPDTTKFYLIGGSFKHRENAHTFFQQMKSRGYDSFHMTKEGNFYIVGIGIYDTEGKAFRAQKDFIDRYPDSGAWVLMPGK